MVWLIDALQGARVPLALAGGAFLLGLAWRTWHSAPATRAAVPGAGRGLVPSFAGTFVLTLSNPATILSFIAVFGALGARLAGGLALGHGGRRAARLGAVVAAAVRRSSARLRTRFDARAMAWVNRASACALAGFALWQWAGLALAAAH